MLVFILILLLLAAIFGVLGAVLKTALVLILAVILAITVVIASIWWSIKRQMRQYATGERGVPGAPTASSPTRPPGSGPVIDTQGRVKRDELPE